MFAAILSLFFLSGFCGLVYELLWFRQLGLILGNTVQAASTVMTAYMLGLALGSLIAVRCADRCRSPLRMYGLIELLVGGYALLVPLLLSGVRVAYCGLYADNAYPILLTALRFSAAVAVLAFPTTLMGLTLPLLARAGAHARERFASRLGLLYGANTLGAVCGVVAAGFYLLPTLGLKMTNCAVVVVSIVVGLLAIAVAFVRTKGLVAEAASEDPCLRATGTRGLRGAMLLAGCCGAIALGLEVAWFRALILVFGSTTYSFTVMLAIFLLGIGLGPVVLAWVSDKVNEALTVVGWCLVGAGSYTLGSLYVFDRAPYMLLHQLRIFGLTWESMLAGKVLIAGGFLFIPALLFGIAFPACAKAVRAKAETSARAAGLVYLANTVGASLGASLAGFILLPALGVQKLLVGIALVSAICGVFVFSRERSGLRISPSGALVVSLLLCAVALFAPPQWDKQLLASGPHFAPWAYLQGERVTLRDAISRDRLLYFAEGTTSSVSVMRRPDEVLAYATNGKIESDTEIRSMALQRMMGHLPMLFHPDPKTVLNLGLGAGVTFGALSCYPVEHLEAIEIEKAVEGVARTWSNENHNVLSDPRARITWNDGRNHMMAVSRRYDVITSDPFEPVVAGAGSLYTVEHFEQARACLTSDGIMAQFLPMYELSQDDYKAIIATFVTVFPRSALFFTGYDTILLGFTGQSWISFEALSSKFENPKVRDSLRDTGFVSPQAVLGAWVADLSVYPELTSEMRPNTDDLPFIEFSAPRSAIRYTPDDNYNVLLSLFSPLPTDVLSRMEEEIRMAVEKEQDALRMALQAGIAKTEGRIEDAVQLFLNALNLKPENPIISNEFVKLISVSADNLRLQEDRKGAYFQYQIAIHYNPKEFWPLYHLVNMSMSAGKTDVALRFLEQGLAAYPDSPLFIALRGKYRGTMEGPEAALEDLERAIKALPRNPDLWEDYAYFAEQAGMADRVITAQNKMKELR